MTEVEIRDVSKFTLRGLDLDIEQGELLTLLGASGSGKSTLLRLIAGLESPDEGTIRIGGRLVTGPGVFVTPEERRVGIVFQNYCLFPHLTVEQNVAFGISRMDRARRRERVGEMLEMFDLTGLEKRTPHQISGGQQQRVALARAMAVKPELLLFDEPFSNLDEGLREAVRADVRRRLVEQRTTSIFVSHDRKDAMAISDRIAVLNRGVVEQLDEATRIYSCPRSAYVAEYFGKSNFVDATSEEGGFRTSLGFFPAEHALPRGRTGKLSIRPNWCRLDGERSLFRGRVREVTDYGEYREVQLDTETNGTFCVHLHQHEPVSPGADVGVEIDAPCLHLLENSACSPGG